MKITINNLAFERNNQILFEKINCSLSAGELLQLRGANGSGKSTLLRIIAGFIEPQHGDVLWDEKSIFIYRDHYQQHLNYIGHQNGIKLNLTVQENLQLYASLASITVDKQAIKSAIKKMGLAHLIHTQTQHLSAGQLRRLSLAKLLLNRNSLWILDEPTTALDSEGQALLTELLDEHLGKKGCAIIATHHNLDLKHEMKMIWLGDQHDH